MAALINAGEGYGDSAAMYWATKGIAPNNSWYENAFYATMGSLASLWTPCTSDQTVMTLLPGAGAAKYLGRAFWQYYPKENSAYSSQWFTRGRGWRPPYKTGLEAQQKLSLPSYNPATAVRPVYPPWWKFVKGPRKVQPMYGQPGGGIEYKQNFYW